MQVLNEFQAGGRDTSQLRIRADEPGHGGKHLRRMHSDGSVRHFYPSRGPIKHVDATEPLNDAEELPARDLRVVEYLEECGATALVEQDHASIVGDCLRHRPYGGRLTHRKLLGHWRRKVHSI
ncbi:MAG: hypothetical protein KC912_22855 [Proteobacteria bacterium]|nr:hypothetical protein [Pseudomonadota bacterium]